MRKGILEYCVLTIIARSEVYGTEILKELKAAKILTVEGTLYPLLTRLKKGGMLSYRWEESHSGPPRKYYTITEDGKALLSELGDSWKQLASAVHSITLKNESVHEESH